MASAAFGLFFRRMGWQALWCCLCAVGMAGWAQAKDDFLPADQAFQVSASVDAQGMLTLEFDIAPQTHLYRDRLQLRGEPASVQFGPLALPVGQRQFDESFGKVVEVYRGLLTAKAAITVPQPVPATAVVHVGYQGCADAGLCYPPQTRSFKLQLSPSGQLLGVVPVQAVGVGDGRPARALPNTEPANPVTQALASGSWLNVVAAFVAAGLLLSLTPCVLPMVPILSSIILGQGQAVGRARGLALALSYSQGMALVYTALGVAAGMLGQGLAAYLQQPLVLLAFAVLMALLALSMFGLYDLRLPAGVQSWLAIKAHQIPGGRFVSVFVMGAVSALVVSPCVSAPLAGALLYIGQSGNVWLGAVALYAMALGMSVPLLLVGLSAGSVLPKAGRWMSLVKALMGVLMLVMAVWVSRPAWPYVQACLFGASTQQTPHASVLPFQRVRTLAQLDAQLKAAAAQGKPVMVDFYADWCVACIEMEQRTFSDAGVQSRLQDAVLLQVDVTANNDDDRALLQRFKLFGPPGILFFDAQGQELTGVRVIGFQPADTFAKALTAVGL